MEILGIERHPVKSTDIKEIGYDESTMILEVEFHSGGVYRYFGVPPLKYEAIKKSSSPGHTFNRLVLSARDHYSTRRVG